MSRKMLFYAALVLSILSIGARPTVAACVCDAECFGNTCRLGDNKWPCTGMNCYVDQSGVCQEWYCYGGACDNSALLPAILSPVPMPAPVVAVQTPNPFRDAQTILSRMGLAQQ